MAEMIIPGTYIDVRAEGLISAARVATGIVGVVGTAARGDVGEPVTLASFANARELFGLPDDYNRPEDGAHPLTLVRALEHIKVDITPAEDEARVSEETHTTTFDRLDYGGVVPSAENRIRIFRGTTRRIDTLNLRYRPTVKDEVVVRSAGTPTYQLARAPVVPVDAVNVMRVNKADETQVTYGPGSILYNSANPPAANEVNITTGDGALTFGQTPTAQDTVIATYAADHAPPRPGRSWSPPGTAR
jgi:hypothetical protein